MTPPSLERGRAERFCAPILQIANLSLFRWSP